MSDDTKPLSSAVGGLPIKQEFLSVQKVIDERMTLTEAIEAATAIVGCYPNGGRDAGDSYIGALAGILGKYPRSVALKCADPFYGVTLECKFLPTVADVVNWCEHRAAPLYRDYEREKRIAQQLAERAKAKPAVPPSKKKRYTYGEFLEWAKANGTNPRPIGASEPGGYMGPEKL